MIKFKFLIYIEFFFNKFFVNKIFNEKKKTIILNFSLKNPKKLILNNLFYSNINVLFRKFDKIIYSNTLIC